jgi:hypothetical protein
LVSSFGIFYPSPISASPTKHPRFATARALRPWFPGANTPKRRTSHRTIVILIQLAITFLILVLNLVFTLISIGKTGTITAPYGEYFEGDCEKVKS